MMRALALGLLTLLASSAAADEPVSFDVRWKLQSRGLWPPAVSGDKVVVKTGDTVTAYSASTGRLLWTRRLANLRLGEGTMAAGDAFVYVLSNTALELLDLTSGKGVSKRPISEPTGVLFQGGSVYVAGGAGLLRLDGGGNKILQKAPSLHGELRGADGDYVAIYQQASPKRLTVANLRTGKVAFEFKLLPTGSHQVARMADGRIAFIDFTRSDAKGTNPRKLYYTEADYVRGKKLRDIPLAAKYTSPAADIFWIAAPSSGKIFVANHGKAGDPSTLFAFDPEQRKTLWTRSGDVAAMGLLLHDGRLWTGVAGRNGQPELVSYSVDTGDVVSRLPLDAAGSGAPVLAGSSILVRTRSSTYCLAPRVFAGITGRDLTPGAGAAVGTRWRAYLDRTAGYAMQAPDTWSFKKADMRKLGGMRFVIPFVRTDPGSDAPLATVHILTWEAAGRDAQGLWRSVLAQRQRTDPKTRFTVTPIAAQGGSGGPAAVMASYHFKGPGGAPVQMRSLCLISHGVAFELRGWASPSAPQLWQDIEGIFRSFQPRAASR